MSLAKTQSDFAAKVKESIGCFANACREPTPELGSARKLDWWRRRARKRIKSFCKSASGRQHIIESEWSSPTISLFRIAAGSLAPVHISDRRLLFSDEAKKWQLLSIEAGSADHISTPRSADADLATEEFITSTEY